MVGRGGRLKREGLCVYTRLIHIVVNQQQKLTQHCKAITLQCFKKNKKKCLQVYCLELERWGYIFLLKQYCAWPAGPSSAHGEAQGGSQGAAPDRVRAQEAPSSHPVTHWAGEPGDS